MIRTRLNQVWNKDNLSSFNYRIKDSEIIVLIVAVGLRKEGDKKDVYKLVEKMIHLRLIETISKK
jgi:D-Tyr-tRNAtyr deacylase